MSGEIKDVLVTVTVDGREYKESRLMVGDRSASLNGVYLDYTIYVDKRINEGKMPMPFHQWLG